MTNREFSDNFDTLLNSYAIAKPMGIDIPISTIELDEYEKSIFLTNAQEDILYEMYQGYTLNRASFDETEELKRYLGELVSRKELLPTKVSNNYEVDLPKDLWFITEESAILGEDAGCFNNKEALVVPTEQDNLYKILQNPFKCPNSKRVLRLDLGTLKIELVSKYEIIKYKLKYLSVPSPIILIDLPDELSIKGIQKETECKLHPMLHKNILDRAVKLAYYNKRANFLSENEEE